jgi:hypothetical protein
MQRRTRCASGISGVSFFSLSIGDRQVGSTAKGRDEIRAGRGDRRSFVLCLKTERDDGSIGGIRARTLCANPVLIQKGTNRKGTRSPRKLLLLVLYSAPPGTVRRQTDPKFGKQKNS